MRTTTRRSRPRIVYGKSESSHDLDGLNNIKKCKDYMKIAYAYMHNRSILLGITNSSSCFFLPSPEERQLALQPRMRCLPGSRDQFVHDNLVDGRKERVPFSWRLDFERLQMRQSNQLGAKSCHTTRFVNFCPFFSIHKKSGTHLENNIASSASSLNAVMQVYIAA